MAMYEEQQPAIAPKQTPSMSVMANSGSGHIVPNSLSIEKKAKRQHVPLPQNLNSGEAAIFDISTLAKPVLKPISESFRSTAHSFNSSKAGLPTVSSSAVPSSISTLNTQLERRRARSIGRPIITIAHYEAEMPSPSRQTTMNESVIPYLDANETNHDHNSTVNEGTITHEEARVIGSITKEKGTTTPPSTPCPAHPHAKCTLEGHITYWMKTYGLTEPQARKSCEHKFGKPYPPKTPSPPRENKLNPQVESEMARMGFVDGNIPCWEQKYDEKVGQWVDDRQFFISL